MKTIKGYQVVIEDNRSQYEEPGIYIRQVHTSYAEAEKEFNEAVEDAKTNTAGDFDWLASAFETYPNDVKEKWNSGHWVEFKDIYADDKLDIYINEVDIVISECNEITDDEEEDNFDDPRLTPQQRKELGYE